MNLLAERNASQLLLQRMNDVAKRTSGDEWSWFWSMQRSTSLALALAAWDGSHCLDELRQFSEKLKANYVTDTSLNHYKRAYYKGRMVRLYLKRAEIPDSGALREYTDWLQIINPGETGAEMEFIFQPAWHYTEDPVVIGAMNRLFGNPDSPWGANHRDIPGRAGGHVQVVADSIAKLSKLFAPRCCGRCPTNR